jgi:thioredoxin-like negative regulator of GroEL
VCEVALNVNMNNFRSFEQFDFLQIFVLDKDRNNFHERKERNVTTKPICVGFYHKLCCKSTELDRLISKLHKFRGLDNVVGSLFRRVFQPLQEH